MRGGTAAAAKLLGAAMLLTAVMARAVAAQLTVDPVVLLVRDANTHAPLGGVHLRLGARSAVTDGAGLARLLAGRGDTILARRVGYAPGRVVVTGDTVRAALEPPVSVLPPVRTEGAAGLVARATAGRTVRAAREAAQSTLAALVATLPGVSARSSRGEATWQLRGARAEQVQVTLDGVPLNSPATGSADATDMPLAALAGVQVVAGADPSAGSGAIGGTIALTSSDATVMSLTTGSFGARALEAAGSGTVGGLRLRAGAAWRTVTNDFPFFNTDGVTRADTAELRANNDERRLAVFASAVGERLHLMAFASRSERGLASAMNVRAGDRDRALTERAMVRGGTGGGNWTVAAGVRMLHMRFDDPSAATLGTAARVISPEGDAGVRAGGIAWRAGVGADWFAATGLSSAVRTRGWLSAERGVAVEGWRGVAGVRVDAIEGSAPLASPWVAIEGTGPIAPYVRVAQAFRAPTLNDLYVAAPQRLGARALAPERTTLDVETGVHSRLLDGALTVSAAAYTRTVEDAIIWFPGNFAWTPSNVGREQTTGAEMSLRIVASRVDVGMWMSATRAELQAGALVLPTPYVSDLSGGATITVRDAMGTWTAIGRGIGRRSFAAAPATVETTLPPVGLLDVSWSHALTTAAAPVLVAIGVTNLLDTRWESVRRYPSVGRAWTVSLTYSP